MRFDLSDFFIVAFIALVFTAGCVVLYKLMRSKRW
jgi:hypothetical protein